MNNQRTYLTRTGKRQKSMGEPPEWALLQIAKMRTDASVALSILKKVKFP